MHNHSPNEAGEAYRANVAISLKVIPVFSAQNYNWEQLFPATLTPLPHGANVRVCVRIFVSSEGESSGSVRQAICPVGAARQRAIGCCAFRKARGEVGHPIIWGGKGRVALAALSNIWEHEGEKGGPPPTRQHCCHTKGTPGLTQHKLNPHPRRSIPQWNLPGNILGYTGNILPYISPIFFTANPLQLASRLL